MDKKNGGGRPPKYRGASRPVTITLPETILDDLRHIDADRGLAIVKLTEAAVAGKSLEPPLVEVVRMANKTGLIVVGPSKALGCIPFVHLIEVAPGRHLIALDSGHDFKGLELAIHDVLEEVATAEPRERELIKLLLENVRRLRKAERVSMAEILLINMD